MRWGPVQGDLLGNIWAVAAGASKEGICHQLPPSVRLPANPVISLVFLAGMAQIH